MTMQEAFTAEIDSFLAAHQLEPATFGRQALNDPNFVSDLRAGRSPNLRTIERVREFIAAYQPKGTPSRSGLQPSLAE